MRRGATVLLGVFVLIVGCGAAPEPAPPPPSPDTVTEPAPDLEPTAAADAPDVLIGSVFVAETLEGQPVMDRLRSSLRFELEGRVVGDGGCNSFRGTYEVDGASITFGPMASTKKMCPPAVMDQETRFFQVLERVRTFGWDENGFLLLSPDDGEPSRFEPMPMDEGTGG